MKHNLKSFGNIHTIFGILSLAFLARTAFTETRFSNEFWVSTSTNTANLGTMDNPYDGSTQPKFDAVLTNLPPNSTLHILAGTYQTFGDSGNSGHGSLKSGQKILGSGIDATIIQIAPGTPDAGSGPTVLSTCYSSGCSNIEVCDLTCDCNDTATNTDTLNGVILFGTQNAVRRVKVIHAVHHTQNSEAWGIKVGNTSLSNSAGNVIEECEVSQYDGGGISAINMDGCSGIIRNNRVFLSSVPGPTDYAFNNSYAHDVLIEGNYVDGASVGVYGDTGGATNMIITHNTFKNCGNAVGLNNAVRLNLTIAFNNIDFTNYDGLNPLGAFSFSNPNENTAAFTNILVFGNTIVCHSPYRSDVLTCFVYGKNVQGLVVANNRVDPTSYITNCFINCANVSMYNNYDLNGNFLTNLNQVASPNGVTRRTVTYSGSGTYTYNATYADKYIGIKGFSNDSQSQEVDIVLPSAVGHSGKDFVVVDETGLVGTTKIINIKPTSPNQINGGPSVNITAPNTAKTVINDGVNWFAR
jgi:hypothetical protein